MDDKQRIDALDKKIVALFEQRIAIAEKAADSLGKRELRRLARRMGAEAADKAVSYACDVSAIAYTEELLKLMICASLKHQKRLLRRKACAP